MSTIWLILRQLISFSPGIEKARTFPSPKSPIRLQPPSVLTTAAESHMLSSHDLEAPLAVAGLNMRQLEHVETAMMPFILIPFLRPPTALGVARAKRPVVTSIGQMFMTLSSKLVLPAKETEYPPLAAGRSSKVATLPRFVPMKQQMLEYPTLRC